jgi:hypothetical protein
MAVEGKYDAVLSSHLRDMSPARWDALDAVVCALLLLFGVLQIVFVERAPDFRSDDVFYFDAARALIHQHFYGINGHPETNMPPGLSGLIALMCLARICGHVAILRIMAALQTAAFLATYAFLRQVTSRVAAVVICLLLITSPIYFSASTETLVAYFPYFVATMLALLVARDMEGLGSPRAIPFWTAFLALLCCLALMMASVAIALVGALVLRAALLRFSSIERSRHVSLGFLVAALVGAIVQGIWMHRTPAPLEWPLAGYPRPYLQQLLVKSGNDPELGMASFGDFVARIAANAADRTALLSQLIAHHWIDAHWASPAVAGVFILIIVGWLSSVRRSGGEVHDWYFAGHEFIYLLWPWTLEYRFFLPVAPLACLYVWRGAGTLASSFKGHARSLGAALLPLSILLAIGARGWLRDVEAGAVTHPAVQAKLSIGVWMVSALLATWLIWRGTAFPARFAPLRKSLTVAEVAPRLRSTNRIAAWVVTALLMAIGLTQQIAIARANIDPHSPLNGPRPDVDAGIWIRQHTDPHAVIMARHLPTTYHFSNRHEVWFPPSSNAALLMDGIRRLGVDYVVVVHRQDSYYLPPDDSCFDQLLRKYPRSFQLVFSNAEFRVFRTTDKATDAVEQRPHRDSIVTKRSTASRIPERDRDGEDSDRQQHGDAKSEREHVVSDGTQWLAKEHRLTSRAQAVA